MAGVCSEGIYDRVHDSVGKIRRVRELFLGVVGRLLHQNLRLQQKKSP
jgi:hypothetical protein